MDHTQIDYISRVPRGPAKGSEVEDQEAPIDLSQDGTVKNPINREPPMQDLVTNFLTQIDGYERNHGPIQHLLSDHEISVEGLVDKPLRMTAADLISRYPQHEVTCALQCAGNRRHSMRTQVKEVQGVDWFDAAVMNCTWEGPRLCDILLSAGAQISGDTTQKHVQFASYGTKTQEDDWYGGSIPLDRAMAPAMDVIIAVKMNGKPLSARHGFPARSLVPGVLGARSVKWLDRIIVSDQESPCFYQQHDYKILPPDATDAQSAEPYWSTTPAMLEMPVNACVAYPTSESTITLPPSGIIEVKGYAVPQGADGPVVRVQVSTDEGKTWDDAELVDGGEKASKWSWTLWHIRIKMAKGRGKKIFAKATDQGGNVQQVARSTWNLRGVGYNGHESVYDLTVV